MRQRTVAIGAGQGLRGGMGQAAWAGPCSVWAGFGDAAEGDLEAEGAELADVVGDMAADVALALVVVRAGVLTSHAGVSQQLGGLELGVPGGDACLGRAASSVSDDPRLVRPDLTMTPLTWGLRRWSG